MYSLGAYPYVLQERDDVEYPSFVRGLWVTFDPSVYSMMVVAMDGIEGYKPTNPELSFYLRTVVQDAHDPYKEGYTYFGHPALENLDLGAPFVASGDWREWLHTNKGGINREYPKQ